MAVAEGLCSVDVAADEVEPAGVPSEVFAVECGVVDGDVFCAPEGVFGVDLCVADYDVACVLE